MNLYVDRGSRPFFSCFASFIIFYITFLQPMIVCEVVLYRFPACEFFSTQFTFFDIPMKYFLMLDNRFFICEFSLTEMTFFDIPVKDFLMLDSRFFICEFSLTEMAFNGCVFCNSIISCMTLISVFG